MSYVKKLTFRKITFEEGHPLHGLELLTRPVQLDYVSSMAILMADIQTLTADPSTDNAAERLSQVRAKTAELFRLFASKIKSWNYQMEDEDGNAVEVPPTVEGIQSIDDDPEVFSIMNHWLETLAMATGDLGKESGSGETSAELSGLMEPLSPSLAS